MVRFVYTLMDSRGDRPIGVLPSLPPLPPAASSAHGQTTQAIRATLLIVPLIWCYQNMSSETCDGGGMSTSVQQIGAYRDPT